MSEVTSRQRLASGRAAGITGIIVNTSLAALKLAIGVISGSVAIMADAVNNITDVLASAVTVAGYVMARKSPDQEHPFGHARAEYLAGFLIYILIIVVAAEFFISSLKRVFSPEAVLFSPLSLGLLLAAVAVKLLLGLYYRGVAKKIASDTLHAAAFDSFSDVAVTLVAALSFFLSPYTALPVDGVAGLIVALIIFMGGARNLSHTISPLLGRNPEPELLRNIVTLVMGEEMVLGVHDAIIHDYGPGHITATIHAELDAQMTFADAHAALDRIERQTREQLGLELVIHGDPLAMDRQSFLLRQQIKRALQSIDARLGFHDMQLFGTEAGCTISLHVVIPYGLTLEQSGIEQRLSEAIRAYDPDCTRVLLQFDQL